MAGNLDIEVVFAVEETLGLYDHLVDGEAWENLGEVLDPAFTLQTPGGTFRGADGVRAYETAAVPGGHLPAHHVVNTQVEATERPGVVRAWSRYLLVTWEYAPRVGDYLDALVIVGSSAKLLSREIVPRGAGAAPRPEHASFERWRSLAA